MRLDVTNFTGASFVAENTEYLSQMSCTRESHAGTYDLRASQGRCLSQRRVRRVVDDFIGTRQLGTPRGGNAALGP